MNYHEYCVLEVTDVEEVGVGLGDYYNKDRVCVSLTGEKINSYLGHVRAAQDWISLTPECAKELYELLKNVKHIWEEPGRPEPSWAGCVHFKSCKENLITDARLPCAACNKYCAVLDRKMSPTDKGSEFAGEMREEFGKVSGAIAWLCNVALSEMTNEDRLRFFARIRSGYCHRCGRKSSDAEGCASCLGEEEKEPDPDPKPPICPRCRGVRFIQQHHEGNPWCRECGYFADFETYDVKDLPHYEDISIRITVTGRIPTDKAPGGERKEILTKSFSAGPHKGFSADHGDGFLVLTYKNASAPPEWVSRQINEVIKDFAATEDPE